MSAMSETLRNDIVAILAGYEVEWDEETFLRNTGVVFSLDGRKIAVTFASETDAADTLRQKLRDLGARAKPSVAAVPAAAPPPPPEPVPQSKTIENREGYTVFRSAEVIGIELDADLMIEKGRILVIPLRVANKHLNMSKEDFLTLFGTEAAAPTYLNHTGEHPRRPKTAAPARPVANEENDILAFLQTRTGGVKPAAIAMALGMKEEDVLEHLRQLRIRAVVFRDSGFWRLVDKMPPTPAPKPKAKFPVRNSQNGVTPQMGRILAAMAYATKTLSKSELTTQEVKPYLDDRDGKQYSARLPGCAEKGLVIRGRALSKAHGWHYQITSAGIKAVQQHGFWAYESDRMPAPEWLIQVAVRSD